MITKIKRWLPTIVGFLFLEIPRLIAKLFHGFELEAVNNVCSIMALIAFSFAVCLDENWRVKEEFKLREKGKLERLQGIITIITFYGCAVTGYLLGIEYLMPFYARKDGFSVGLLSFVITLFVVGIFTVAYKWTKKIVRRNS